MVYQNPEDNRQKILIINLERFPYLEFPFGEIPTSADCKNKVSCKRMAIIYVKLNNSTDRNTQKNKSKQISL